VEPQRPDTATTPKWLQPSQPNLDAWKAWITWIAKDAKDAWDSGRTFHVVRLNLGGQVSGFLSRQRVEADDVPGALQQIEAIGWRLFDTGYAYEPLRQRSHMLTDTQQMTGNLIGVYTFKRPG
jgi:hypothetical protein